MAAQYFASIRRLGGSPVFRLLQEARALGLAGDRDAALQRIDQAHTLGANPEAIEDARRVIAGGR